MELNEYIARSQQRTNARYRAQQADRLARNVAFRAEVDGRLRQAPEPRDVRNGDALNALLVDVTAPALYFEHAPQSRVPISVAQIRQIPLSYAAGGVTISLAELARGVTPAAFRAGWTIGERLPTAEPDSLEFFLTERYCLYTFDEEQLYRCRIHHAPWALRAAEVGPYASTMVEALGLSTPPLAPLLHYSEEIKVDIWPLLRVTEETRDHVFEPAGASEPVG